MCGIAGWVGYGAVTDEQAHAVAGALAHRGPDGVGVRRFDDAGLIHTRLAIIDLSARGEQPMSNEDGTVWVTFNGELYNHHELRRGLEARGHRFVGGSDTEVIPHLYEEEGPQFLSRLRGMFAIAVLDLRRDTLVLGRDRFGIKPLFFTRGPERVSFASEIPALRRFPGIGASLDPQGIADYAGLLYVPAPRTLFAEIEALEPGALVVARKTADGVEIERGRFHRWSPSIDHDMTVGEATEQADRLVTAAVGSQLESDVPLGSMLSGGIDSSLIAAAAQHETDGRLLTFNVRPTDAAFDETAHAAQVAQHLHTTHETIPMRGMPADWASVTGYLRRLGQPLADPALFAVSAVSKAMREHVTVALSGDGGDELFGGYRVFWKLRDLQRLRQLPAPVLGGAAAVLTPLARRGIGVGHTVPDQLRSLARFDDTALVQQQYALLDDAEQAALVHRDLAYEPLRRLFEPEWSWQLGSATRLERLAAHTLESGVRHLLGSKFLTKADMGSMWESLEVRVPLLDEDLADFAFSLPQRLRVEGRSGKRVLRAVAARHLPDDIATRGKHGFAVPFEHWVDASFMRDMSDELLDPASPVADVFARQAYAPWVESFAAGTAHEGLTTKGLSDRVLMLVALHACLT